MNLLKVLAILDSLSVEYEVKHQKDKISIELVEDGNLWEAQMRQPHLIKQVTETEYFAGQ